MSKLVRLVVFFAVAFATLTSAQQQKQSVDPMGNVWTRVNFGAVEANYWVNQLGGIATGNFNGPTTIQYALDHYYTQSPEGTELRWGNGWLSKFVASQLAVRGFELRLQLSDAQNNQVEDVLLDAVSEGTFQLDSDCGINPYNTCSEDFVSFVALIARVKNFYPNVVSRVGVEELNRLEKKYLSLTLAINNGYYSLSQEQTEDGIHILASNHSGQSAVYSGILLIYLNHAIESYSRMKNPVPNYYRESSILASILDMFSWLQSVSAPDGSYYLNNCLRSGVLVSCGDVYTADAIPQVIPVGRLIRNLFGDSQEVFSPGKYSYQLFDTSYTGGNISNFGRQSDYNIDNKFFKFEWEETPIPIRKHLKPGNKPVNEMRFHSFD